ncbi:MAG: hypothetical protein IE909_06200 [Campylobacterales bacterium]|nr:hypothetical protein [Campylobacterales bacterium]
MSEEIIQMENVVDIEQIKNDLFEKLKLELLNQARLLKRFYQFCEEHSNFEYDESGINDDEGDDILRKANKIRDKIFFEISESMLCIFESLQTNSMSSMITGVVDTKEYQFRFVVEVFEEGFHLEISSQNR